MSPVKLCSLTEAACDFLNAHAATILMAAQSDRCRDIDHQRCRHHGLPSLIRSSALSTAERATGWSTRASKDGTLTMPSNPATADKVVRYVIDRERTQLVNGIAEHLEIFAGCEPSKPSAAASSSAAMHRSRNSMHFVRSALMFFNQPSAVSMRSASSSSDETFQLFASAASKSSGASRSSRFLYR